MGGMTYTPVLIHWRWYDDDSTEAASTQLAAEDTTYEANAGAGDVTL